MAAANSITINKYRELIREKGRLNNKYKVAPKEDRIWRGNYRGRYQEILFDSKKEMYRFQDLLLALSDNLIADLQIKEKFKVSDNKYYESDFSYFDFNTHKWTVEDVKSNGTITDLFKLKWDLVKSKYHNIEFKIIFV